MAGEPAPEAHRAAVSWRRVWLTALAAFVVWHTIFDVTLDRAMHAYLDAHARHAAGAGPAVTIRGVMGDARQQGAWLGLAGASVVIGASYGWWRLQRTRGRATE